jgi:uncharacterized protein (DUF952 family)
VFESHCYSGFEYEKAEDMTLTKLDKWIYHITTVPAWQAAQQQDSYGHPSLETEGFIHCSYRHQVAETAQVHFKGQTELLLLRIDPTRLKAELKAEVSRSGAAFPHLYGPLNLDAVERMCPFDLPMVEQALQSLEQ